jgi:putative mRNA 3-end processing factor
MRVRGDRRRRGYDRGFVLSDHADWPALIETCKATRAKQVLLTHGYSDALTRYLNEQGIAASALRTQFGEGEEPGPSTAENASTPDVIKED